MSNIFYLPRIHSQAGAKLYFRQTGTSTPQNTYQDSDLQTAHANPVVADASGYFAPIYLDPSLPAYRMIHTDGSNEDDDYTLEVLLETIRDDIPSSSDTSSAFRVKGTSPTIIFEETDASAGNKIWRINISSEVFNIAVGNDAEDTWTNIIGIDRDGVVASNGSFTGTLSDMTTSTTVTVYYRLYWGQVTLTISGSVTGTSDATSMAMSGLPAAINPTVGSSQTCLLTDAGTQKGGWAVFSPASDTINFGLGINGDASGFTGSGLKGLPGSWSVTYPL